MTVFFNLSGSPLEGIINEAIMQSSFTTNSVIYWKSDKITLEALV